MENKENKDLKFESLEQFLISTEIPQEIKMKMFNYLKDVDFNKSHLNVIKRKVEDEDALKAEISDEVEELAETVSQLIEDNSLKEHIDDTINLLNALFDYPDLSKFKKACDLEVIKILALTSQGIRADILPLLSFMFACGMMKGTSIRIEEENNES